MSIKKKLGLGVASAAIGLSLIGGGTWAAFNDVETMENDMTAGTLDLSIEEKSKGEIHVSKLVPGDMISRTFRLANRGNIDIQEVLLETKATFKQGTIGTGADLGLPGNSIPEDFYKQFEITMFTADNTDLLAGITGTGSAVNPSAVTLHDFIKATEADDNFNIAGGVAADGSGLPNGDTDFDFKDADAITINLTFINDDRKENGEYLQNKYMGNGLELDFTLEATQSPGEARANDN